MVEKSTELKRKEERFRDIWSNIFKISDDENQEFDLLHEQRIMNYIQTYEYQIETYEQADDDRLDDDNYMTRHVTNDDIIQIVKEFKNKQSNRKEQNK